MTRKDYIKHLIANIKELDRRIGALEMALNRDEDDYLDYVVYLDQRVSAQTELSRMLVLEALNN